MKSIRLIVVGCAALSVSGCLGGGSASGTVISTGGATMAAAAAAFDSAAADVQMMGPSTDPLRGTASYLGEVKIDILDQTSGAELGYALGDVAVDVNFDAATDPMDGTVSNVRGEFDGTEYTATGTLSSANTNASNGINAISATTLPAPASGEATGMSLAMAGTLSDAAGTPIQGDVYMTMQGTFMGSEGAGVFGGASATVDVNGMPVINGGTFYLNKQ